MPTPGELAAFFERCNWPRALTQAERSVAFEALTMRCHDAHSHVCQRDEIADSWIGVMEGFLSVQDTTLEDKLIMYTGVAPGGWIGEGSLLKPEQRKYEIMATRPTVTVHLPRKTFGWLLERSIPFNHFMLSHLNERLGQFIAMVKFDRLLEPTAAWRAASPACSTPCCTRTPMPRCASTRRSWAGSSACPANA